MRNLVMRLQRPTGYYLPLVGAFASAPPRAEAKGGSARYAQKIDKKLEKPVIRPTARWYGSKKAFVPPPKNPTVTPAPSAKGKAVASGPKGGGARRALRGMMSAFAQPLPRHPDSPAMFLFTRPRKLDYE